MDISLKQELREAGYKRELDLSSLVEACGESAPQWGLSNFTLYKNIFEWIAGWDNGHGDGVLVGIHGKGSSTEEAVARLWLELNKNGKKPSRK